jgi:hypothetical protein
MAMVTLSDGTSVDSVDVESATLYAKRSSNTQEFAGKMQTMEDRLYINLSSKHVMRVTGELSRADAAALHAEGVPVFFKELDPSAAD